MFGGTREVEAQLQREAAAEAATERHRARGAAPGRGLLIQQPSSLLRREHRAAPRRRTGGQKLTGRVSLLGSAGPRQPASKPHRRPEKSRARSEARRGEANLCHRRYGMWLPPPRSVLSAPCQDAELPTPAKHSVVQGQRGLPAGGRDGAFVLDFGKFQKEMGPGVPPESGGGGG